MLRAARSVILTSFAVSALLLIAACGDDSDGPPAPHPDVPEGAARIDQDSLKFQPNSLTVAPGTEVFFTNSESAVHTIDIDGENVSGDMERGDVFSYIFDAPGEFKITCPYHPQMRSTVTVSEATATP